MTDPVQLGLALIPDDATCGALLEQQRAMRDVDDQAERSLRETLRHGVAHSETQVRDRVPQSALQTAPDCRGRVDQRHERRHLRGQRAGADGSPDQSEPQSRHVGTDREHLPLERLTVARVLGPVQREPLPVQVMRLFDALDDVVRSPASSWPSSNAITTRPSTALTSAQCTACRPVSASSRSRANGSFSGRCAPRTSMCARP